MRMRVVCFAKMERTAVVAVLATAIAFTGAYSAPFNHDVPATRKAIDLAARRLGELSGRSGLTCEACKIIVDTLDTLFAENRSTDEIVAISTDICIDLHIEDRNVCTLVVKEFQVYIHLHYTHAGDFNTLLGQVDHSFSRLRFLQCLRGLL